MTSHSGRSFRLSDWSAALPGWPPPAHDWQLGPARAAGRGEEGEGAPGRLRSVGGSDADAGRGLRTYCLSAGGGSSGEEWHRDGSGRGEEGGRAGPAPGVGVYV